MPPTPPNLLIPYLKSLLEDGLRPVAWIGAGASVAAGFPTLATLAQRLRQRLENDLDPKADGYAVLDAYVAENGKARLSAFLQKQLGQPAQPTALHQALARLTGASVFEALFTTNYDRLLENALNEADVAHVVQDMERNFVLQATDDVQLVKIHGDLNDWMNVILTSDSYAAFEAKTLLVQQLDISLKTHPVVFIGCSMTDPRLLDWLAALSKAEREALLSSKAILTENDWNAVPAETRELLDACKIRPILVPDYDAIPRLLMETAQVLAPLDVNGLIFSLKPDEDNWTVVGPTPESAEHVSPNPLLDEPFVSLLNVLRKKASSVLVKGVPEEENKAVILRQLGRQIGERLNSVLFSDEARQAVIRRIHETPRGRARLTVRVADRGVLADRALALPWELLMPEEGIFAVEMGMLDVVREAFVDGGPSLPEPTGPVRVAVTVAAPEGQSALNYEAEQYRLQGALAPLGHDVAFSDLGGVDDLVEVVVGQNASVVHFSGHGLPGELVFEDDYGFYERVKVDELARKLNSKVRSARHNFPLVFFLASCHGATGADEAPWQDDDAATTRKVRELAVALGEGPSTAATLHRNDFVQVIGYFGPVGDRICTLAEERYYRAIARGENVLQAANEARARLSEPFKYRGEELWYPMAWAQLAVYHRGPDRPLATTSQEQLDVPAKRFSREMVQVNGLPVLEHGFVGRRRQLHEIRRKYRSGQRLFVIKGMGGLGKTALASHLLCRVLTKQSADQLVLRCQHLKGHQQNVSQGNSGPLSPRNTESLAGEVHAGRGLGRGVENSYNAALADLRNQVEEHGKTHQLENWEARVQFLSEQITDPLEGFQATVEELLKDRPGLVLYADNTEALQYGPRDDGPVGNWQETIRPWWDYLEELSKKIVVLLSTRYFWDDLDTEARIEIPPMSESDVLRMIEPWKQLGKLPYSVVRKLAERVDGHPRTVEILDGLVGDRLLELGRMPDYRVWEKVIEPILPKQAQEITADLLLAELWQRLSPEGRTQARHVGVIQVPAPRSVVEDLGDKTQELTRTSFLTRYRVPLLSNEKLTWDDRWGLHSLVKDFVAKQSGGDRQASLKRAGLAFKEWVGTSTLISDTEEGIRLLHEAREADEAWPMVQKHVLYLRRHARYAEALTLLQTSESSGVSGDALARALMYNSQMRMNMGDRRDALGEDLEKALMVAVTDETRAYVLHELASFLEGRGRYEEAAKIFPEILQIKEATFGKTHQDYGASLHQLAVILSKQGKYDEAEILLRQSFKIHESTLGQNHSNLSASLHQLAVVLSKQGKYDEAERHLRQALDIFETTIGRTHPSYGMSLHALAGVLESQGKFQEAEHFLRQSLDIKETALGKTHPSVAATLNNLAGVVAHQGRLGESEPLFKRAVDIYMNIHGPNHPETAVLLSSLASLQAQLKNPEASATAKQAFQGLMATLGPEHPVVQQNAPSLINIINPQAQHQALAAQVRDGVVGAVQAGALAQIREGMSQLIQAAEKDDNALMASYCRAVLAVLNGEEPVDVPELFVEDVDAVREAVRSAS